MAYKSRKCFVCEVEGAAQSHHLLPLEYGGPKNGPTVDLCPSCHLTCHYEAESFYSSGVYLRLNTIFKGSALKRAVEIINYIVKQKSSFESSDNPAEDARRGVNLSLSHEELQLAHIAKKVSGFSSLERFVKSCIHERILTLRKQGKL